MNSHAYTHLLLLPEKEYPPQIAIKLLVGRYPEYMKDGLFECQIFLEHFIDRCLHILDNLPDDERSKRNIEIEFGYLAQDLRNTHNIDIDEHISTRRKNILRILGVYASDAISFQKFQKENIQQEDLVEKGLIVRYMNFLFEQSINGMVATVQYIESCIHISQFQGGFELFAAHIENQLISVNLLDVHRLEEMNRYLGSYTMDEYTQKIMSERNVSYSEATNIIGLEQIHLASLHAFINKLFDTKIFPYFSRTSTLEKYKIGILFNDFRDIIDPEQRIPHSFVTPYSLDQMERSRILYDGRNLQ